MLGSACSVQVHDPNMSVKLSVIGYWKRIGVGDGINYGTLEFSENESAVFTSIADTLFRFSFVADNGRLLLTDPWGESDVLHYNMSGDSMICFDRFREYESEVCYARTHKSHAGARLQPSDK
jgi:hypothetical protein